MTKRRRARSRAKAESPTPVTAEAWLARHFVVAAEVKSFVPPEEAGHSSETEHSLYAFFGPLEPRDRLLLADDLVAEALGTERVQRLVARAEAFQKHARAVWERVRHEPAFSPPYLDNMDGALDGFSILVAERTRDDVLSTIEREFSNLAHSQQALAAIAAVAVASIHDPQKRRTRGLVERARSAFDSLGIGVEWGRLLELTTTTRLPQLERLEGALATLEALALSVRVARPAGAQAPSNSPIVGDGMRIAPAEPVVARDSPPRIKLITSDRVLVVNGVCLSFAHAPARWRDLRGLAEKRRKGDGWASCRGKGKLTEAEIKRGVLSKGMKQDLVNILGAEADVVLEREPGGTGRIRMRTVPGIT